MHPKFSMAIFSTGKSTLVAEMSKFVGLLEIILDFIGIINWITYLCRIFQDIQKNMVKSLPLQKKYLYI